MSSVNISDNTVKDEKQEALTGENIGRLAEMYKAGIHFGYSRSSRHPGMNPYIFGTRNNVEIFDLERVVEALDKAVAFFKELGVKRSSFLMVGTKPEASDFIEKAARELGMPNVTRRWLGGTLTNFNAVKKNIAKLEELSLKKEKGELNNLSKKEMARMDRRLSSMEKKFGGLKQFKDLPSALLVIDPKEEKAAVKEAGMLKIPVVAILNSDCDPRPVTYLVPGNDSSVSSIGYLFNKLIDGYKEGLKVMPPESPKPENTAPVKSVDEKKPKSPEKISKTAPKTIKK